MQPKFKAGDRIRVIGFVMLQGLDDGDYRIARMSDYYGQPTYSFTKPRGKRIVCRHYCKDVDRCIEPRNGNRIEILP